MGSVWATRVSQEGGRDTGSFQDGDKTHLLSVDPLKRYKELRL